MTCGLFLHRARRYGSPLETGVRFPFRTNTILAIVVLHPLHGLSPKLPPLRLRSLAKSLLGGNQWKSFVSQSSSLGDGGVEGIAFFAFGDDETAVSFGANGFLEVVVLVVAELFLEVEVVVVMGISLPFITYLPLHTHSSFFGSRCMALVTVAGTPASRARPYSPEDFKSS